MAGGQTRTKVFFRSRAYCEFFSVASVQRHFDSGAASGLHIQVQECLPQGWFGQSAYSVRSPPTGLRTSQASKFESVFALGGPHPCAEVVADAFCAFHSFDTTRFDGALSSIAAAKFPWTWKSTTNAPQSRTAEKSRVCSRSSILHRFVAVALALEIWKPLSALQVGSPTRRFFALKNPSGSSSE